MPAGELAAGAELVEAYAGGEEVVPIPYAKYRLANGLRVLLHEDHSDPLVQVNVVFFEHMMFQGSEHVGDDEHFQIVSDAGGTMNGFTGPDTTTYFETLPENHLEPALWLEADRMGSCCRR